MKKFLTSEELSTKDEFSFRLIAFLSFFLGETLLSFLCMRIDLLW